MAKGLDVGTSYLVGSKIDKDGKIVVKKIRNAFLKVDKSSHTEKFINSSKLSHLVEKNSIIILGDDAFSFGNLLNKNVHRPMHKGLISAKEVSNLNILSTLISSVLGKPSVKNEVCCFSVPSAAIGTSQDITYHKTVLERILSELGYSPFAKNEAEAVVFSELAENNFTGLAISFGAGLTNVCLSYKSLPILMTAIERGGDYIDNSVSNSLDMVPVKACNEKEKGVDLLKPKNQVEECIVSYYTSLIKTVCKQIVSVFDNKSSIDTEEVIPIILTGGTSKAKNFDKFFEKSLEEFGGFPFKTKIAEPVQDRLTSVSKGLLVQAMEIS